MCWSAKLIHFLGYRVTVVDKDGANVGKFNIMHRQIDGVAMGSPPGPSFTNMFVGYNQALLFKGVNKPLMYYRYVDDSFAAFNDEDERNEFFAI